MSKKDCECPVAGFCERHHMNKNTYQHAQCQTSPEHRDSLDSSTSARKLIAERNSRKAKIAPATPEPDGGPGSNLKLIFARWGLKPCKACNETASKMDELGFKWCQENIDTVVGWVDHNAKNNGELGRKLFGMFPQTRSANRDQNRRSEGD